jgi:peptidoglycan hydrolase CwlO-like protein
MDRAALLKQLAQTERDIAAGKKLIENQQPVVAELERSGRDTWTASAFLRMLLGSQTFHQSDRDRLQAELAAIKE